jgi:hypothetical protein
MHVVAAAHRSSTPVVNDPASIDPAAWSLAMRTECAALPILRAAKRVGVVLPPDVERSLARAALPEIQRCMDARLQLVELDAICDRIGIDAIVLKSGVAIAEGHEYDLGDVDLLAAEPHARLLAGALEACGYARFDAGDGKRKLTPRDAPNRLSVEIQPNLGSLYAGTGLDEGLARERSVPLASFRRLRCLRPADHLWHVLHHSVVAHPPRQGLIRDLVALVAALERCSESEIDMVRSTASRARAHAALCAMLDHAIALRGGHDVDDPFVEISAARYALADGNFDRWLNAVPRAAPRLYALTLACVDERRILSEVRLLALSGRDVGHSRSPWHFRRLCRVMPRAGAKAGEWAQGAYRWSLLLAAMLFAWRLRSALSGPRALAGHITAANP